MAKTEFIGFAKGKRSIKVPIQPKVSRLSSCSIYLPLKEAKFLKTKLRKGEKLYKYINELLQKYYIHLPKILEMNPNIRRKIQTRNDLKIRFSFRPFSEDWVKIQVSGAGCGVSCSIIVRELLRLEMSDEMQSELEKLKNVVITTPFKFSIQISYIPKYYSRTYRYHPSQYRGYYRRL